MSKSKKVTVAPIVDSTFETITEVLAPTVANNDSFGMELFEEIEQKTGFTYKNLEQDSKKMVFEFRNNQQILFVSFTFKRGKVVATGNYEELALAEQQIANEPASITELEAEVLNWIVYNDYQGGEEVVGYPVWAPEVSDFSTKTFKSKKSLGGVVSSLSQKGLIKHTTDKTPLNNTGDGRTSDTVAITEAGMSALQIWEKANVDIQDAAVAETHEDAPSAHELEERLNDLESGAKKGVGRGYANAGKKYAHSGVRVEEFKIGKTKVKKGEKLFFKIGKEEVSGVFSHLNQCNHCPEGYVVIRFEGKNYERRQSRVSTHATEV